MPDAQSTAVVPVWHLAALAVGGVGDNVELRDPDQVRVALRGVIEKLE